MNIHIYIYMYIYTYIYMYIYRERVPCVAPTLQRVRWRLRADLTHRGKRGLFRPPDKTGGVVKGQKFVE